MSHRSIGAGLSTTRYAQIEPKNTIDAPARHRVNVLRIINGPVRIAEEMNWNDRRVILALFCLAISIRQFGLVPRPEINSFLSYLGGLLLLSRQRRRRVVCAANYFEHTSFDIILWSDLGPAYVLSLSRLWLTWSSNDK